MQSRELSIPGCFVFSPQKFPDDRGYFLEWYRFDALTEAMGHPLELRQANLSVSRRGVVRGIHYADLPPSQAKYVTVSRGSIIDYVVDIREGSPTFGSWDSVKLDAVDHEALYIAEGLGHCFVALEDDTQVGYLVSDTFKPEHEHGITPLDPQIGLEFPFTASELMLSPKDLAAPTLGEARSAGSLPNWERAQAFYADLNRKA